VTREALALKRASFNYSINVYSEAIDLLDVVLAAISFDRCIKLQYHYAYYSHWYATRAPIGRIGAQMATAEFTSDLFSDFNRRFAGTSLTLLILAVKV
jgi:hypothetical protein